MGFVEKAPQVFSGMAFLGAGGQKLAGTDRMVDDFARYGYPQWFRVVTGVVETSGALGMLVGLFRPALVPVSGLILGATMIGALATHVRLGDPTRNMIPPAVLLTLTAGALAARRTRRDGVRQAYPNMAGRGAG